MFTEGEIASMFNGLIVMCVTAGFVVGAGVAGVVALVWWLL